MNNKNLKRIYEFLEWYVLRKLEAPCSHCSYFDCKKNTLNSENIIRKKYKLHVIDWRYCLRRKKEELRNLMKILRLPKFRKWSHEECDICKKRFFRYDMKSHLEFSKQAHTEKISFGKKAKFYRGNLFYLCKKCNNSYVHRKNALKEGFRKI